MNRLGGVIRFVFVLIYHGSAGAEMCLKLKSLRRQLRDERSGHHDIK